MSLQMLHDAINGINLTFDLKVKYNKGFMYFGNYLYPFILPGKSIAAKCAR